MKLKFQSAASARALNHLVLCGVRKDIAKEMMLQLHNWSTSCGHEWTVSRLKDLKTWFIHNLAGEWSYRPPWFSYRIVEGKMIPKGVFTHLWTPLVLNSKDKKKIVKALSALMVYTAFKSDKVTQKQYIKTVGAIRSNDVLSDIDSKKFESLGEECSKTFLGNRTLKWSFHPAGLNTGKPYTWSQFKYLESFVYGLNVPFVGAYLEEKGNLPSCLGAPVWGSDRDMMTPGEITIIQERGFKPRVVAMPHASIQVALYPLHRLLDDILRKDVETDCTHNQELGAIFARDALKQGKKVFSVDLSGATDNFPRSFQIGVLKGLGLGKEAMLIEHLSTSEWKLSHSLQKVNGEKYVKYTKGQPQGMYASFPLFGLSHNLLCTWMCKKLSLSPIDSFRVLGDDIVITDSRLHNLYRNVMKRFKVPISEDKSIGSSKIAEFAGYIITPDEYWKPAKVPNSGSPMENFVNYLKVTGHNGLNSLPGKVRTIAKKVIEIPESAGGLGYNPSGLPYAERIKFIIQDESDIAIPKYFGIHSSFPAAKLDYFLSEAEVYLDWLNDQFNLFDKRLDSLLVSLGAQHLNLSNITERRALAYQLSILHSVDGSANMQSFVGSKSKDLESTHAFVTDFQKWKNVIQKATKNPYFRNHDPKSHAEVRKIVEKWNLP